MQKCRASGGVGEPCRPERRHIRVFSAVGVPQDRFQVWICGNRRARILGQAEDADENPFTNRFEQVGKRFRAGDCGRRAAAMGARAPG
jgi:hypothetical protein